MEFNHQMGTKCHFLKQTIVSQTNDDAKNEDFEQSIDI